MRIYATKEDVLEETGLELDEQEAKQYLRTASLQVEHATDNSPYDVDEDGYPTDSRVRDVLKLATCLQAKSLDENQGSFSLGSQGPSQLGSLRFDGGSSGSGDSVSTVDPEVGLLLANEGLLSTSVRVRR